MRVNSLKFAGQRHHLTYATTGTVEVGDAVVLTADGTVARGAGIPVGIVTLVEADGHATVLSYGEVITAKTAAKLTTGYVQVLADASGQLAAAGENAGRPAIVHAAGDDEAAVTLL